MRHRISLLLVFLSAASCSSIEISSQRDPVTTLTKYQTYAWGQPSQPPINTPPEVAALTEQKIVAATDDAMAKKGFQKAAPGALPDFFVIYYANIQNVIGNDNWAVPYDGAVWGPNSPRYGAYIPPYTGIYEYTQGLLTLVFKDAKTGKVFWTGYATAPMDLPGKNDPTLKESAQKLVSNFVEERTKEVEARAQMKRIG